MKKIAIILAIGFFLVFFSVSAYAMALCANTDYNTFLMSQGTIAPADLINEEAYETKTQKFNLTYDLVNLTPDVLQARIELYRYLDEEGPNDGWKLEETLTLDPPFQSSIPIVFEDLKRGKTYSITLIVVTDMPNLLLQDGSSPIDMTVKTVYFLWPKEHGMHLSATTSFEGEPRREHFKMKWSGAEGSAKTKIKARHSDNLENPIVESSPEGELTFSREEVWSWPADNLSSISVDALDFGGNIIATAGFIISPIPPIKDYKILPCIPPPSYPYDPEVSSPDDKTLDNRIIRAVVSHLYGGAFFKLGLWSYGPNSNGYPRNLINNTSNSSHYGVDGLLCQTAPVRLNDKWHVYDGGTKSTMEEWENDPNALYSPKCMDDYDAGRKYKFHWNPTQGGSQPNCGYGDSNQRWNKQFLDHSGNVVGNAMAPVEVNGAVTYTSIFKHWLTLEEKLKDGCPEYYEQPQAVMNSTVSLVSPDSSQSASGIKINSKYRLHCGCGNTTPNTECHCADLRQVVSKEGVTQYSYEFDAINQDWAFFGSEYINHVFKFNSTNTSNIYGMVEDNDCTAGDNDCLAPYGWKNGKETPNYVDPNWVPYSLMRTDGDSDGSEAWVLIYNPMVFDSQKQGIELRRIYRAKAVYADGVVGDVTTPISVVKGLSTERWSPISTTYIFVGPTMESVMNLLSRESGGVWPRLTSTPTTYSISGTVSGATASGVMMSLTGASTASTTTDSSGNYTFSNLANGTYTVTPSKTGYTFSPASYTVTINGANVTGKDFTATAAPTYSISGIVTLGGAGFSGVTMTLSGAASSTTTTASNGTYTFSGLANGSYTVTPSKSGYTFSPTSTSVTIASANQTGKNFTATAVTYSISGTVSGATASGVTMTLSGAASSTTTTATNGTYSFSNLANGTYTVTPSKTGYTFSPTSASVTISGANQTGKNFTATAVSGQFKISGTITLQNVYLNSMDVELTGTVSTTTQRQGDGTYQFTGLPNGSYRVTPVNSTGDLIISPAYADVTINGQDVTNINFLVKPPIIKGAVTTTSGNAVSGIKMRAGQVTVTTDAKGNFTFADLEPGDYTLEPSEEDAAIYTFDPPNRKIKIKENDNPHTGQDFKATPK